MMAADLVPLVVLGSVAFEMAFCSILMQNKVVMEFLFRYLSNPWHAFFHLLLGSKLLGAADYSERACAECVSVFVNKTSIAYLPFYSVYVIKTLWP